MSPVALSAELHVFADDFELLASLRLDRGVLVLFGPSGAGKTLTLQALAGLRQPHRGRIRLHDQVLLDTERKMEVAAHRREIGYVPQHDSLFPFADVEQNVVFGLPRRLRDPNRPAVRDLMHRFGIDHLRRSRPQSLSGGERRRVALVRALTVDPRLLLLDEPFAGIDRAGRESLRATLLGTIQERQLPTVIVTHDREDAMRMGDLLIPYERGRTGPPLTPAEVFEPSAGGAKEMPHD